MPTFDQLWNADVTQPVGFGVFDPQGSNYNTSAYGVTPQFSNPGSVLGPVQQSTAPQSSALPNLVGTPAATVQSQPLGMIDSAACSTLGAIPGIGSTLLPGCPQNSGGSNAGGGSTSGGIGDTIAGYFTRSVVIILGFIFVAAGLYLFGAGVTVEGVLRK